MRYSVIVKTAQSQQDEPFIFLNPAKVYFSEIVLSHKDLSEEQKVSVFLLDNLTNEILQSYDSLVASLPVEYDEVKVVSTSTKQMIDNLHDLMELKGLSATLISIHSGVSLPNLSRFFKGEKNPTLKTYVKVQNAINLL